MTIAAAQIHTPIVHNVDVSRQHLRRAHLDRPGPDAPIKEPQDQCLGAGEESRN